jgi:hypothetical protein
MHSLSNSVLSREDTGRLLLVACATVQLPNLSRLLRPIRPALPWRLLVFHGSLSVCHSCNCSCCVYPRLASLLCILHGFERPMFGVDRSRLSGFSRRNWFITYHDRILSVPLMLAEGRSIQIPVRKFGNLSAGK